MEEKKTDPATEPAGAVVDELRELGTSFAALGRSVFKGGRVLSVELLRSLRGVVERAREEVERMAGEKKE